MFDPLARVRLTFSSSVSAAVHVTGEQVLVRLGIGMKTVRE
jgi:hypothetical protein